MEDPSPFRLNRSRIFILVMGVIVVLIGISTAMGGLSGYQQLKQANAEAHQAAEETAAQ
ncbi:hypothetical protein [Devosia sp.]|uniref:hypothetical protein n=1 Tax=Devosia sp. TaxID=1871048 RepID=UPI002AFEE30E|nr:hypothetical protein [Devosia sp.]